MHLFTALQLACLAVLWIVKSSTLALAFPFFVVGMVPFRLTFKYFFNPRELDAVRIFIVPQLCSLLKRISITVGWCQCWSIGSRRRCTIESCTSFENRSIVDLAKYISFLWKWR